tara:strand:- start:1690 stop:2421 length:732 start_codon:yes stop_codon:yes gene_type:complete
VGESILFIRYKQIFFNASPYIDQIIEFEGELDNCKNKVVGSNYDQNENINQVTKINLIVEETQDYKLIYIIKAFWVPIVFSGTLSIVFYKVINKNSAALIFVAFLFIITFGLDNFNKGLELSKSNYIETIQPYRDLKEVLENKTIYHNGYLDEEKISGISNANLIYIDEFNNQNIDIEKVTTFQEYYLETFYSQPNYEQRYNSRKPLNTDFLKIIVENVDKSETLVAIYSKNTSTLYILNYDN